MKGIVIGILGNTMSDSNQAFTGIEKQYVNSRYVTAVERNGGTPILIPVLKDKEKLHRILDLCDGLLFPGGEDMDPRYYGEGPHSKLGEIKPEVDDVQAEAFRYALENQLPCFGICRGMQLMVALTGGSLYQDIYEQRQEPSYRHCQLAKRDYEIHAVLIERNSRLSRILGEDLVRTNSMHHQSVKWQGPVLKVTAHTEDGVVEAVESEDGMLIGVQWHPEEMIDRSEAMNLLFRDLTERASKRGA